MVETNNEEERLSRIEDMLQKLQREHAKLKQRVDAGTIEVVVRPSALNGVRIPGRPPIH